MPRPRNPVPVYKKHPTKDEARCWVHGKWVSLGKYGTDASRREYERVCAQVREAKAAGVAPTPKKHITVAEVLEKFAAFAVEHYRTPDGKPTSEITEYKYAVGPLLDLYFDIPAAEFGPLALQAVRQRMIDRKWCRTRINKLISRVRLIFKWAAGQELVPPSLPHGLACVQGLQKGRTSAKESEPVEPVPREHVEATLPFLSRQVRTMVELQLLTGMRPGEACALTFDRIDRTQEVWLYTPQQHKTRHRGKTRAIPIGPRARALIEAFVKGSRAVRLIGPTDILFSPTEAREELYEALRATRKTKVQPSQAKSRRKANPTRKPGTKYTATGYANAVQDAAERAKVPHWHPNQLRHTFATEVRKEFGLEAVQVLLGHSRADVTQVYAERNLALAATVAAKIG